jgi:hypothetical protein
MTTLRGSLAIVLAMLATLAVAELWPANWHDPERA